MVQPLRDSSNREASEIPDRCFQGTTGRTCTAGFSSALS